MSTRSAASASIAGTTCKASKCVLTPWVENPEQLLLRPPMWRQAAEKNRQGPLDFRKRNPLHLARIALVDQVVSILPDGLGVVQIIRRKPPRRNGKEQILHGRVRYLPVVMFPCLSQTGLELGVQADNEGRLKVFFDLLRVPSPPPVRSTQRRILLHLPAKQLHP